MPAWAKLCFELSPQGRPTVVSVVTRDFSDDCNSFTVEAPSTWLRISRLGQAFAFHASTDGNYWQLARYFSLGPSTVVSLGFEAQSPLGGTCTAHFTNVRFAAGTLDKIRDGS